MDEECASVCFGRLCKLYFIIMMPLLGIFCKISNIVLQYIMTGGVPYSLTVPKLPTRDSMTDEQFDRMMENGYKQAKNGQTLSIDEAFAKIREGL